MITISLCMIVRNEEDVLRRCLASAAAAADEIIIVDTGSTDKTKEIAAEFTDKIYDFEWVNDFSAARNASFEKASMDYQMWLDADDVIPEESLKSLLELKEQIKPETDIVTMRYITHFDETGKPRLSSTRERLLRREKGYLWQEPVHEFIAMSGKVEASDIEIHHRKPSYEGQTDRNINIYAAIEESGRPMTPREQYYYARELADHRQWIKAAYYFERFLDSGMGWIEDNIAACMYLGFCYNRLGETKKILPAFTRGFNFDAPRPEICCEIGYHYKRSLNFGQALKWFKLGASIEASDTNGFIIWDYYGFIPNFECGVCSYALGDIPKAFSYIEKAASFKPDHPSVIKYRRLVAEKMSGTAI